jgi:hypothetical protein
MKPYSLIPSTQVAKKGGLQHMVLELSTYCGFLPEYGIISLENVP